MANQPLKMKNGLGNNNDLEKMTQVWVVPLTKRFSSSFLNLTIFPLSPILPFFIFYGGLHKVSHDYVEVFAVHYFGTPTFGKDSLRIKNWEWEYENNEFGVSFDT